MVDFEIRGFQEEIAKIILDEIVFREGSLSIVKCKDFMKIYGKDRLERLL